MSLVIKATTTVIWQLLALFFLATVTHAASEEYRQCSVDETCEIGEFLFDDDYTPITTGATCTLTSRDSQGALLIDQTMTSHSDGWYSYEVDTTGFDYGLYRGQICCTYESETFCLDKSFEVSIPAAGLSETQVAGAVWNAQASDHSTAGSFGENSQNPTLSANEIWGHSQRTLTGFGTLISDIWDYSTRSLNSFSSLITNIWNHDERKITSSGLADGELATKSQVEAVSNKIEDLEAITQTVTNVQTTNNEQNINTQILLEQLNNTPIIETFFEEGETSSVTIELSSKIQETKKIARLLVSKTTDLQEQIAYLNQDWENIDYKLALEEVGTASLVLGAKDKNPGEQISMSSSLEWLNQKWKSPVISNLITQTDSALDNVNGINREIKSYGKTFISQQYLNIASEHTDKIHDLIGQENDPATSQTLFGYIAELENISDTLSQQSIELDEVLWDWPKLTSSEKEIKLTAIKDKIMLVNKIPDPEVLLQTQPSTGKYRENFALALQGLIGSNLILLANDADQVTQNIWLEHGSVKFKTLVTNPSTVLVKKAVVKYYLPLEIKNEHIIEIEDGLKVKLDTDKNTLYVTGEFLLQPEETKIITVEVVDVWLISESEIASFRKQTETLFNALKNTSYLAQGSIIKANIEVSLDKIELLNGQDQTPEIKIRSYREAVIEMESVKSKLETLNGIVSASGSIPTATGFGGGAQSIVVWGLIIILIAGFVSLFAVTKEIISMKLRTTRKFQKKSQGLHGIYLFIIIVLVIFIILLLLDRNKTQALNSELPSPVSKLVDADHAQKQNAPTQNINADPAYKASQGLVLGKTADDKTIKDKKADDKKIVNDDEKIVNDEPNSTEKKPLARVIFPEGYQTINVRAEPDADSSLVGRLYVKQNVTILQEENGWVKIETNYADADIFVGWILQSLVSEIEQKDSQAE